MLESAAGEAAGGVAQRRPHPGLLARVDPADAALHPVVVALAQLLDDVELAVLAARAREAVDGVLVADRLEGLAHQEQRLLLDVDDPLAAVDLAVGGARHVHQEGGGDVPVALVALDVDARGGGDAGPAVDHVLDQPVGVEVVALAPGSASCAALGAHQLEVAPDLADDAAELVEGGGDEALLGARLAVLAERAPGGAVVLDLVVPLVVVEDLLAEVLLLTLGLDAGHVGEARLLGRVEPPPLGVLGAAVGGPAGRGLLVLGGGSARRLVLASPLADLDLGACSSPSRRRRRGLALLGLALRASLARAPRPRA